MSLKCSVFCCILLGIILLLAGWVLYLFFNPTLTQEISKDNKQLTLSRAKIAPRLLFMMASYSFDQFTPLQKVMDCMRDICNSGWDVTVHIQVSPKSLNMQHEEYRSLQQRMFCLRSNSYIPIVLAEYPLIGFGLNSKHRSYMQTHLQDFDYFSFAEEDMQLTVSHLQAYISGLERIRIALPDTWMRFQIGFLRYEDSVVPPWQRVTWEYLPKQIHIVDMGAELGKYIFTNNLNQAIYILPREQLVDLENRCEFLSAPGRNLFYQELRRAQDLDWKYMSVGVSEWSSSFQQILQCGLRRLIPVDHFQLYMIHHATDKAQKRRLRKELMTMQNWTTLLIEKSKHPITIQEAQFTILPEQYNLHLMDTKKLEGKVKWSWE